VICVLETVQFYLYLPYSGAGTNLKVGAHVKKKIFVVPLHFLFCRLCTYWWAISWRSVQFDQFLFCYSSTHGAPQCPAICKTGGTCPLYLMESAKALWLYFTVNHRGSFFYSILAYLRGSVIIINNWAGSYFLAQPCTLAVTSVLSLNFCQLMGRLFHRECAIYVLQSF